MKKRSRGKWGESGLSAITIAALMDCHVQTTKRYLYKLRENLGVEPREIPDSEIGKLINYYIESKKLNSMLKELNNMI